MRSERSRFEFPRNACVAALLCAGVGCGSHKSPDAMAQQNSGIKKQDAPMPGSDRGAAGTPSGASASDPVAGAGAAGAPASDAANGNEPAAPKPTADRPTPDQQAPMAGAHGAWPDPRNGCPDLNSGFPGDEACMAPPAPGEGMQIHIGPSDYKDPAQINQFVLHPGEEVGECWSYHTPNDEDIYYQGWALSGRPGTHHIFNSMLNVEVTDGGGFHVCVDAGLGNSPDRLGSLPGAGKPYMPRAVVAPENEGLGQLVHANTPAEGDMHYFNTTDSDILREFWLNLYFIPKDKVTHETIELRGMGGVSWSVLPIQPGTDEVYQYECPITADGRVTSMIGHYHAHGKRLTAHIRRASGERQKIFDMYDYKNAAMFPFDSVTTNPPLADGVDGAFSGVLDVFSGDVLEWECHVINDGDAALNYSNSVQEGEMCNVFGMTVGPEINCVLP